MRFYLVAVGTRVPDWVTAGYEEYARRLQGGARLELRPVAAAKRRAGTDPARARAEEAERLRAALPARARRIALDAGGHTLTSEALAEHVRAWNRSGAEIAFLAGGPDGLDGDLLAQVEQRWSLSRLTLPHALVRVVLAEQLYRALSILYNQPYHR